jgi:hypothetical protein
MNTYVIAGVCAAVIVIAAIGFALGQRTTCYNFFGMSKGCVVDTTVPHH